MNKKLLLSLSLVLLLGFSGVALADTVSLPNPLCPVGADGITPLNPATCIRTFPQLITALATFLTTYVVGSLAVIMFVWAGILFLTSHGEPGKIELVWSEITRSFQCGINFG